MSAVEFKFENGQKVKDKITGFEGIIIARIEWNNGCLRYSVQGSIDPKKPGEIPEAIWLDEEQVTRIGKSQIITFEGQKKETSKKRTGGPANDPTDRTGY